MHIGSPLNKLFRLAVLAGVETAVKIHIRRGDDLNARDSSGMTPLMLAALKNKASVCSLLLAAGARPSLLDAQGRDALTMARASNAAATVAALEEAIATTLVLPIVPEPEPNYDILASPALVVLGEDSGDSPTGWADLGLIDDDWDAPDLSCWEADVDTPPPETDKTLAEAAAALYRTISAHVPVDDAEGWGCFNAFLPERAAPLRGTQGEDESFPLRSFLLRAVREGSVPERSLFEVCTDGLGSVTAAWEAVLRLTLGELGAATDDREEHGDEPFVPDGSEEESIAVSEALSFIEDIGSGRNEPARFYSKEMRIGDLLTAKEELMHGRNMEECLADASGALAFWGDGVAAVIDAAELVRTGQRSPGSMSLCSAEVQGEEIDEASCMDDPGFGEGEEDCAVKEGAGDLLEKVDEIAALSRSSAHAGSKALVAALVRARLSPAFLAGLDRPEWGGEAADTFRNALARYNKSREIMVLRNLRLVLSVVKRYQGLGLPLDDLIQEGNIGLIKAVEKFDWRKGFRFSTYATWWIRQQAARSLADLGRIIRIPVHAHEKLMGIKREAEAFEGRTGSAPQDAWLAERLGMPVGSLSALRMRLEEPVPFHEPDEFGVFPEDSLVEDYSKGPEAWVERVSLIKTLGLMLSELEPRVAEIMVLRYGLDGTDSRTLEETGEHFCVTRERIRQIEGKALKKLGHKSRSWLLAPFLRQGIVSAQNEAAERAEARGLTENAMAEGPATGEQPKRRGRPPRQKPEVSPPPLAFVSPEDVARVLESARECGAIVEDSRDEAGGLIVRLPSEKYSRMKRLARDLVFAGFSPHPGMTFKR